MPNSRAKAGHHYIDKLGRVVMAIPERNDMECTGCMYEKSNGCTFGFPVDIDCDNVIFVEVTDDHN
jgi:hypothetical protein